MLPLAVILALPVPFILLLLFLGAYHLTPLLTLLPHLTPSLSKLSTIIPHPRRNLPREFFNLPPRLEDDSKSITSYKIASVLGVRGKLMLVLIFQAVMSLACGWGYLLVLRDGGNSIAPLLALSIIPLPATVLILGIFSVLPRRSIHSIWHVTRKMRVEQALTKGGGITHATLLPRILPYSAGLTAIITILVAVVRSSAHLVPLAASSVLVGGIVLVGVAGRTRRREIATGRIRLQSPPTVEKVHNELERMKDNASWVSSPETSADKISAFSYSPSSQTPSIITPHRSRITLHENGTPKSWLSSPSTSPTTIPAWEFSPSPSIATPSVAHIRPRSRSPSPSPTAVVPHAESGANVADQSTSYSMSISTPGSHLGSVMGGYSPDPFHPMPRGFESLTSFPISPSQMATPSQMVLSRAGVYPRGHEMAFIPEQRESRTGSTWTLETYHTASEYLTPVGNRRAPPPPPMECRMPLPPTPTVARSGALFDWPQKDSTEVLMGEQDWVEVVGEGQEEWGRNGRGVGAVALAAILLSYAFTVPLLVKRTDLTLGLFLVALLIPSPFLVITSYLMRYRIPKPPKSTDGSTKSGSTYRSLALVSDSQLSLPISLSPKLTPMAERRHTMNDGLSKLLEPKPSVANFGFARPSTALGVSRDADEEEAMRRTLARRSGDVWLGAGHAIEGGGILSRAAEMIKPVPAMRVLDPRPREKQKRTSEQDILMPEISISSPSKYDRRASAISAVTTCENDQTMASAEVSAEIQTAKYGRMSKSPTYFYAPGYDVDWMTAGVLPNLVPSIKIGPEVRIEPRPQSMHSENAKRNSISSKRQSSHSTHAVSTSIDLSFNQQAVETSTPLRNRHKPSLSLPTFSPDFSQYRRSVEEDREQGIDLPPIPHDLSTVAEESDRSHPTVFNSSPVEVGNVSETISEEEAMAKEMEQVMSLDTPTRAQFVVSPPASSYGRSSRASQHSDKTSTSVDQAPSLPDLPQSRPSAAVPIPLKLAHRVSLTSIPGHHAVSHPHPPLRMRRSNETISSGETRLSPNLTLFKPSKDELTRIKHLKERALASKQLPREFRPLQLVNQQDEGVKRLPRMSAVGGERSPKKSNRRTGVSTRNKENEARVIRA